jgi:phospholipid/cholesterol/gamma-HCH transport system permease protein
MSGTASILDPSQVDLEPDWPEPRGGLLRELGELGEFGGRTLLSLGGACRYISEILEQGAAMAYGSLPLLLVMAMFIGFSQMNFAFFFLRTIGASDFVGAVAGFATPRVTATVMLGYVFAAKICCGIVAEVGSMQIGEEIDALEATGVDPMHYIVGTRFLAALLWLPLGWITVILGVTLGSYVEVVGLLHGVSSQGFTSLNWEVISVGDLLNTFVVHFFIVTLCTIVACFYGLRTRGGPDAVGAAVARSLVVNLVIVHLVAAACGVLFYGTQAKLPFGG